MRPRSHKRPRKQKPLEMKAAKEAGEEYDDSTREDNIKGRNDKVLSVWKISRKDLGPKYFGEGVFSNGGRWHLPKFVGKADMGGRLAPLGSDG